MQRPRPGLLTTALILCVAVVPLATSVQAVPYAQAVAPDQRLPAQQVEGTDTGSPPASNETTPTGTDGVILSVDLYENGTAGWEIEYRTRLENRDDRTAFSRLQRNLESDARNASGGFHDRIRGTVAAAESATGREMAATEFDVRTTVRRIPREYGVVVYSFRWDGFATGEDGELRAGDALEGFFLSGGERLVVTWPEGYELDAVEPTPDAQRERTVVWRGPTTFGAGGPQLTLSQQPLAGTSPVPVAAAVGVVALAAGTWALRGRVGTPPAPSLARLLDDGSGGDDAELLSNEERVVRLLEERGGRVKQQEVANELGWTEAKTSYVVSNLREEQWIRSFRMGRENVLSLADSFDGQGSRT
ncbi:hypothetical protein OB920_08605 [Halobacteria archaeon HArc-gm2]|nr:hypothetical protein [Halobacteria archaeon HArc-gm2]